MALSQQAMCIFGSSIFNATELNDRIVLYFSGHGSTDGERGFLVPSDGRSLNKGISCIGFDQLSKWVDGLMTRRGAQHLLIILDACGSGLGVLSKSSADLSIEEIAKYPSAHMMTAGLLDQEAYAEKDGKCSLFTRFLAEGLEGKADYTNDRIITLTELLVYVQDAVSKYAETEFNRVQTPMMGKIRGAGEMIFMVKQ